MYTFWMIKALHLETESELQGCDLGRWQAFNAQDCQTASSGQSWRNAMGEQEKEDKLMTWWHMCEEERREEELKGGNPAV